MSDAPTPSTIILRYLAHVRVEKRLAARTVELYTLDLQKLAEFAQSAKVELTQVQTHHIRHWVVKMHSGGRSPRGIALILSGWRGFYAWLGREGLVTSNPVVDVKAPKAAKPLPKALGVDDASQLANLHLDAANPWLEARDAAMVELLYGSGLRVAELTGLDVAADKQSRGWLDLQAAEAHVLGKGSKRRIVPIGAKALVALQAWLAVREGGVRESGVRESGLRALAHPETLPTVHPELVEGLPATATQRLRQAQPERHSTPSAPQNALFIGQNGTRLTSQSIWQRLKTRSQQAGLATPVHPHMLRHSFASHLLQSSGDLRAVQELLGHANITTTQVYTRLDFQHLAKTYDAAHPRAHLVKKR